MRTELRMRDHLLREKRLRKRKDIAKTTLSRILKIEKNELPKSKEDLEEATYAMDLTEQKGKKINIFAKNAY